MTILDQLADHARERVAAAKAALSLADLRRQAEALPKGGFAFEKAIRKPGMSFICECKKASPSKGLIAPDFPYLEIAKAYETAGADCRHRVSSRIVRLANAPSRARRHASQIHQASR